MPEIALIIVSIFIIVCGMFTVKGKPILVKRRYLRKVSEENLPFFLLMYGISIILEGVVFFILAVTLFLFGEVSILKLIFPILLIAALMPAIYATVKCSNK